MPLVKEAATSFDHIVHPDHDRRWNREIQNLRRLEIDYKLEPGWLLDRDIGGPCPFQNKVDELCATTPLRAMVCPVRHQSSRFGKLAVTVDGG